MNAVDTNVLLYAHDLREPRKQAIAESLIRSLTDTVLLWQVACEYLAASRKLAPLGYNLQHALADVEDLRKNWAPYVPTWNVLDEAAKLVAAQPLSFWDALIVAACADCGVTTFYSEDVGGRPSLLGVQFINPFKPAP